MFESTFARAFRGLVLLGLMGLVAASIMMHAFNPDRSARLDMLERHHSYLSASVKRLTEDNGDLRKQLTALESGADGWRDVARREFGLISDGEVVFRFPVER